MKIRVFPWKRLSQEHLAAWSAIQLASPECDSPYFRPEYHQLAAEVGRPVMVGVMEDGDRPVGFFPFERSSFGTGSPVGLRLSDFHGAIVAAGTKWSGNQMLRACGLRKFMFDHLPASQRQFLTGPARFEPSPFADLHAGYGPFREQLRQRGEKELEKTLKKRAKMEREVGPAQFLALDTAPAAFDACIAWKSLQYERTGALNVFRTPWVVDFLRRIASFTSPYFSGAVSTLSINHELLAVHVGMRTHRVQHHWFPTHNADHPCVRYSPGLQLLAEMLEACANAGIQRIDYGKGDYTYKRSFGTGSHEVAEGICGGGTLDKVFTRSVNNARSWLRKTAKVPGLATPVRWYRSVRDWAVMR